MDKIEGKRILIHCRDKFKVFNLKKIRGRLKSSSFKVFAYNSISFLLLTGNTPPHGRRREACRYFRKAFCPWI